MKLLLAHGSSDSVHVDEVEKLTASVSQLLGESVSSAFLSDNHLSQKAVVLPLFLGAGVHVCEDAPRLAQASECRLLPHLGANSDAIAALVESATTDRTIFLLYQAEGFDSLRDSLQPYGQVAFLHGKPSLESVLKSERLKGNNAMTVQPMLLFPGKSLARVRRMISESSTADIRLAPVLSELDGFAELVADCFRSHHET